MGIVDCHPQPPSPAAADARHGSGRRSSCRCERKCLPSSLENKDEVENIGDGMPFTRGNRKASEMERHKTAITAHVVKENHVIDWDPD